MAQEEARVKLTGEAPGKINVYLVQFTEGGSALPAYKCTRARQNYTRTWSRQQLMICARQLSDCMIGLPDRQLGVRMRTVASRLLVPQCGQRSC